ncbi:hypothetical protein GCM10009078_07800 [Cupriavidus gilardii]
MSLAIGRVETGCGRQREGAAGHAAQAAGRGGGIDGNGINGINGGGSVPAGARLGTRDIWGSHSCHLDGSRRRIAARGTMRHR